MRELMESLNYVQTISQNMCSVIVHIYPRVAADLILCDCTPYDGVCTTEASNTGTFRCVFYFLVKITLY